MTLYTTGAASLVEPEVDVVGVYKIHGPSGNRQLAEMRAHIHLKPTFKHRATLTDRSLRSSRSSIRNGWEKGQKGCQYILRERNPLENRAKRAKKRAVRLVERIVWNDCL